MQTISPMETSVLPSERVATHFIPCHRRPQRPATIPKSYLNLPSFLKKLTVQREILEKLNRHANGIQWTLTLWL